MIEYFYETQKGFLGIAEENKVLGSNLKDTLDKMICLISDRIDSIKLHLDNRKNMEDRPNIKIYNGLLSLDHLRRR